MKKTAEPTQEMIDKVVVVYPDFATAYIQTPGKLQVAAIAKAYGFKNSQSAYVTVFTQGLRQKREAYWKNILGDKQQELKEKISQCYDQALDGWQDLYVRIQTAMEDPTLKPTDVNALANAMDKYTRHMQAMNQTYGDTKKYESLYSHIGQEEAEKD